ncbi:MAG: hypothetical protein FWF46_06480 [Oscillospiraceae bacterium]|nr:hypothetical protein [Oscillospiraceae bacterium]
MIKDINEKEKVTFIISSHILSELDLVATKFGFIEQGALLEELTYDELHEHTSKSLVIKVDDVDKAIRLLESKLDVKNYSINKNNEIVLKDYIEEPYKVSKVLINGELKLYTIKKQETTLEEYFLRLVGGEQND